ncbi:hypothetical protein QJS66_07260 [Kocuria rhizophila]|nr:hypothetical protein QJS66_07260 [Kocuria rhizophila]
MTSEQQTFPAAPRRPVERTFPRSRSRPVPVAPREGLPQVGAPGRREHDAGRHRGPRPAAGEASTRRSRTARRRRTSHPMRRAGGTLPDRGGRATFCRVPVADPADGPRRAACNAPGRRADPPGRALASRSTSRRRAFSVAEDGPPGLVEDAGDERFTVYVKDLTTGELLADRTPRPPTARLTRTWPRWSTPWWTSRCRTARTGM